MIPKGYKHTDLGILPEDWEVVRLGEVAKIYQPQTIKQTDFSNEGYLVYGANGIIGKYHSFNHEKEQIAIACRGNTCGSVHLTKSYSWITGNAMVINLDDSKRLNKAYAYQRLSMDNFDYLITGSGQPQITSDIKNHKIPLPPLAEQEKIAEILSTWDIQIQNLQSLITEKQNIKKGLCQTLLTAKTRLKGFSEDWQNKTFEEVFKRIASKKFQIQTKEYQEQGKYPVVDQGKQKIIAYSDCQDRVIKTTGVILFGDHTRELKYIDFDFIIGADGVQLLEGIRDNNKYLYYFLCNQYIPNTGYNRHFKFIKNMVFSIPPLAEQEKIAEILSEADNEITLLEQKLESLKSQKKGLMQILLSGKVRVKI